MKLVKAEAKHFLITKICILWVCLVLSSDKPLKHNIVFLCFTTNIRAVYDTAMTVFGQCDTGWLYYELWATRWQRVLSWAAAWRDLKLVVTREDFIFKSNNEIVNSKSAGHGVLNSACQIAYKWNIYLLLLDTNMNIAV